MTNLILTDGGKKWLTYFTQLYGLNCKTPARLQKGFIRYLYAYDFLKNKKGFENEYWNPEEIIKKFEKEKAEREEEKYKPALTFKQIERINEFITHISGDDFDLIKLELAFYMLFYTDIENVSDFRTADANAYKNGFWTINDVDYEIPEKYNVYLSHLKTRYNSKFSSMHSYIKQLGNQVGIEHLRPKDIIKARKQMHVSCFECGERYLIFKDNWASINGKIMCKYCVEQLINEFGVKKNLPPMNLNATK